MFKKKPGLWMECGVYGGAGSVGGVGISTHDCN